MFHATKCVSKDACQMQCPCTNSGRLRMASQSVANGNSQAQALCGILGYNQWAVQQQCLGQFTVLGVQKAKDQYD